MEDQKVKELAQTLKKSGLAVSDYEAIEKAKAIIGTDIQKEESKKEPAKTESPQKIEMPEEEIKEELSEEKEPEKGGLFSHLKEKFHHEEKIEPEKHKFSQPDYDISREELTVNDLMEEVGVNPKEIPEEVPEGKEKIENIGEEISELRKEISSEEKNPDEEKMEEIKHEIEDVKEEVTEIEKENADEKQEEKKQI